MYHVVWYTEWVGCPLILPPYQGTRFLIHQKERKMSGPVTIVGASLAWSLAATTYPYQHGKEEVQHGKGEMFCLHCLYYSFI